MNMSEARLKLNSEKMHIWDHMQQGVGMLSLHEIHQSKH
jgi:hypothetical protein